MEPRLPGVCLRLVVVTSVLLPLGPALLHAQEVPRRGLPEMLAIGIGATGVLRHEGNIFYSLEYRFKESRKGLHTAVLLGWNAHVRYVNFSLGYSRMFGPRWTAMIATGPGVYSHDRQADDLGAPLEFMSRLEVARIFSGERRLGLRVAHISNAHVSPINPGDESLSLVFVFPLARSGG